MSHHIRLALVFCVLAAVVAARASGALASIDRAVHATKAAHMSRATRIAHEQAAVVKYARHFLGIRYVYGGTSPASGFDCSGFTRWVYSHFGISLPHYSGAQWGLGRPVSRAGLRPGDLVFFSGLGHVGMYIGSGYFIHAPHSGASVEIDSLYGSYGGGYDGARRIL